MDDIRNIVLVGFMGTGKTHVGRILSRRTGWHLVDTDEEIAKKAGKPVLRIFAEDGEPAFRAIEREVVSACCKGSGRIISTGGGAFVDPVNRQRLLETGRVFCLNAKPETILGRVSPRTSNGPLRRLKGEKGREAPVQKSRQTPVRPLLQADDPLQRIKELLAQRMPFYAQAHHIIDTDGCSAEQVADRILLLCREAGEILPGLTTL